ncbi:hypothetical protein ACRAWD_25195 [Caulobacter segnis]
MIYDEVRHEATSTSAGADLKPEAMVERFWCTASSPGPMSATARFIRVDDGRTGQVRQAARRKHAGLAFLKAAVGWRRDRDARLRADRTSGGTSTGVARLEPTTCAISARRPSP